MQARAKVLDLCCGFVENLFLALPHSQQLVPALPLSAGMRP
jgi:hypothetical protein